MFAWFLSRKETSQIHAIQLDKGKMIQWEDWNREKLEKLKGTWGKICWGWKKEKQEKELDFFKKAGG